MLGHFKSSARCLQRATSEPFNNLPIKSIAFKIIDGGREGRREKGVAGMRKSDTHTLTHTHTHTQTQRKCPGICMNVCVFA